MGRSMLGFVTCMFADRGRACSSIAPDSPWKSDVSKATTPRPPPSLATVRQFQQRYGLVDTVMVVAADAGMLSASNLTDLDAAGVKFIVGSRVTKAPGDLASHFHWHGDLFTDGQIVFRHHPTSRAQHRQQRAHQGRARAGPGDTSELMASSLAVLTQTCGARCADPQPAGGSCPRCHRRHQLSKATRFVTVTTKGRRLDTASTERARSFIGLKGDVSNLPAP